MTEGVTVTLKDEKPKLTLGFEYNDRTVKLKIRPDQPFKNVFEAVERAFGVHPNTFRFRTGDGDNIAEDHTPASHDMEEMEIVDVFMFQHGGGPARRSPLQDF